MRTRPAASLSTAWASSSRNGSPAAEAMSLGATGPGPVASTSTKGPQFTWCRARGGGLSVAVMSSPSWVGRHDDGADEGLAGVEEDDVRGLEGAESDRAARVVRVGVGEEIHGA